MKEKKIFLIVGAESTLGAYLKSSLSDEYEIFCTTSRKENTSKRCFFIDLNDKDSIDNLPMQNFDSAIICASITNQKKCSLDREKAYKVNVSSTLYLSEKLIKNGIHVIFPSTSLVFDGKIPFPHEHFDKKPQGVYAQLKSEVEDALLKDFSKEKITILRVTKIIDQNFSLFKTWIETMQKGAIVSSFYDLYFSPVSIKFVKEVIQLILKNKKTGVFNLSSRDQISYSDSLEFMTTFFPELNILSKKVSALEFDRHIFLPKYTTLASSLEKENIYMPDSKESILFFLNSNGIS